MVKVSTQSTGGWIVEALEPFTDLVNGERVEVKQGERRNVAVNLLYKRKGLPPIVPEHTYELKMEKKLKKIIDEKSKSGET